MHFSTLKRKATVVLIVHPNFCHMTTPRLVLSLVRLVLVHIIPMPIIVLDIVLISTIILMPILILTSLILVALMPGPLVHSTIVPILSTSLA